MRFASPRVLLGSQISASWIQDLSIKQDLFICMNRVVWAMLILAAIMLTDAAVPDPPENPGITTIGSKKLATAADCAGVVAFSATQGSVNVSLVSLTNLTIN